MKLSNDEIKHIGHLSRLELSAKEVNEYGRQLSAVIGYIDQLKEVDVANVEPTAQVTGLTNRWREDIASHWPEDEVKSALAQSKTNPGETLKVPKIM